MGTLLEKRLPPAEIGSLEDYIRLRDELERTVKARTGFEVEQLLEHLDTTDTLYSRLAALKTQVENAIKFITKETDEFGEVSRQEVLPPDELQQWLNDLRQELPSNKTA